MEKSKTHDHATVIMGFYTGDKGGGVIVWVNLPPRVLCDCTG